MAFDKITYALCKKYADNAVAGAGAIKGKNCVISSIDPITGGNRVTFQWTLDNGTVQTDTMDVMDGIDGQDGAQGIQGPQGPAGPAGADGAPGADGQDGQDGITPVITITEITGGHRLTITTGSDVQTVDVLDGTDGQDGAPGQDGKDGVGIPEGGNPGQILKKKTIDDYDTEWANDEGGQIIQVDTLPPPSVDYLGTIYQYTGSTSGGLTNGYFYECVFDDPNYIWQAKAVQDPGQALNGIPAGGNTNQILQKHSNADYDAEWVNPASYSQVQADWNQSDNTQVDFIKNKPQNLVQDADYTHTDNNYTDADAAKLANIEAGAQVNVKPDWNAAVGADAEILNKPTLGTAAAKNVPVSGNAGLTEVVMGDDSRLTDARTPVSHTHTVSEISDFPTLGTAAAKDSTNAVTENSQNLVESGAVYTALAGKVDAVSGKGLSSNDYTNQDAAAVAALGTASTKGSTNSVTQNSTDLVESGAVYSAIATSISAVYKPAGSKTCSQLLSSLLIADNLGKVYNITDSGTTTADFVEGAGKTIDAGDNVVIVDVGSGGTHTYKFDLLSGMVDLTNYISKSLTATGLLRDDGTVDTTSYLTSSDISAKADKKVPAATGNLAALDATGNLADSGKKTSAFIEKAGSATGLLRDDGTVDTSTYLTSSDISGKADKKVPSATGNIATLDSAGNLADGGKQLSVFIEKAQSATGLLKDDGTVDSTAYAPSSKAYLTDDSAETSIDDADYVPFYDISATAKKKSLWSNIKSVLKTYFDSLYTTKTIPAATGNFASLDANGNLSDSNKKASDFSEDGWVSGQDKNLYTGDTTVSFTVPDATKAYEPWFETYDGTPITEKSHSMSGTTLTYTIKAVTSAQSNGATSGTSGCKAKLRQVV